MTKTSTPQKTALGSLAGILSCAPMPASQQCFYMFIVEWLATAKLTLHKFFEDEAEYDIKGRLTISSLKKFGKLTALIQQTQKWIKDNKLKSCEKCSRCKILYFGSDITEYDTHEILTYYEQKNMRQLSNRN